MREVAYPVPILGHRQAAWRLLKFSGKETQVERLLSPSDAARILGVVPATVRAMALSGRLPPATMTESGIRLFKREDVERLAAQRSAKADRERGDERLATSVEAVAT